MGVIALMLLGKKKKNFFYVGRKSFGAVIG